MFLVDPCFKRSWLRSSLTPSAIYRVFLRRIRICSPKYANPSLRATKMRKTEHEKIQKIQNNSKHSKELASQLADPFVFLFYLSFFLSFSGLPDSRMMRIFIYIFSE